MQQLARSIDAIARASAWLAALAMAGMVVLIGGEILVRLATNGGLPFTWEYSSYLLATSLFCGLGWTLRTGGHIRVTVLEQIVPAAVIRWVNVAGCAIGLYFSCMLTAAMIMLCINSYQSGSRSIMNAESPLWVPQTAVAFGATILSLQLALRLLLLLTGNEPERRDTTIESAQSQS